MPFLNRLRVIIWCWSSRGELRRDRRVQRTETGDGLGLGVVDIKDNEVETAETIAERIELAAGIVGRWASAFHSSRLRLLDAAAERRIAR